MLKTLVKILKLSFQHFFIYVNKWISSSVKYCIYFKMNLLKNIFQRIIGEDDVPHFIDFPNIPVPEDAYRLLDEMRAMSYELEEKHPTLFIRENKVSVKM